jgi:hypothetical protein
MRFCKRLTTCAALVALALGSACHRESHQDHVAQASAALSGARSFQITLPVGVGPDQTVLSANGELEVNDFASVTSVASGTLAVNTATNALNDTDIGNLATITGVESVGSIELGSQTRVNGSLTTGGTVSQGLGDSISGSVAQHATLTPLFPIKWTATPPSTNGGDVVVGIGASKTLAPGAYGNVSVFAGGALTLTPGSYFFEGLFAPPLATIVIQHQQQPVLVYVASLVQWQGTIQDGGDPSHLLVGFNGILAQLQTPFRGTLVAPSALVQLFQNSSPHVGSFLAGSVQVGPLSTVQFVPFAHWGLFVAPILSVTCVIEYTPTNFGALFGYTNLLQTPFTVPNGPDNQFSPAVSNFVPITSFAPGTHTGVTGVPLPGNAETWQVRNMSIQATRTTLPVCTGDETRIALQTPPPPGIDPDHGGPANPEALSRLLPDVP